MVAVISPVPNWVCSDLHLFHDNIVKYAGRPSNHVELIIENWQALIHPDDVVLNLGDTLMGKRDLWSLVPQLPGRVYHLETGNHDEPHKRKFMEEHWGWTFIPEYWIKYRGYTVHFSHYPMGTEEAEDAGDNTFIKVVTPLKLKTLNVAGHIHDKPAPSLQHIIACVEQTDYKPARLTELLDARIALLEAK